MLPVAPSRAAEARIPLVGHRDLGHVAAYRSGKPVTAAQLLADATRVAQALPERGSALNLAADRYRFAVNLLATLLRGHPTLLPPAVTPNLVEAIREFAPDAYYVADDESVRIDLPRVEVPMDGGRAGDVSSVPAIEADRIAAIVFTSGSTGEPQPHPKRWGSLVRNVLAEGERLAVGGPGHVILGTVPPQHMFGLESTVLMPLATGAALTAERPYFAAQIDAAAAAHPPARTMFTTPFHLQNWLDNGVSHRLECIVSATAPLTAGLAARAEAEACDKLLEIYGCTETGQLATRRPTRESAWQPLADIRIHLRDDVAWAQGGHIEAPTRLADLIELEPDGRAFHLAGRSADVVNIAGKRNSLGGLTHQLLAIPGVRDGVFHMPEERDEGVTRLMAFVVAPGLDAATILEALRARMDPVFLPRPIVLMDALPRRATGKLPREALVALERRMNGAP